MPRLICEDQSLEQLMKIPGLKLPRIAQLLGAQEYLETKTTPKGDVLDFDVKRFFDDLAAKGRHLRLPDQTHFIDDVILEPGEGEIQKGGTLAGEAPAIEKRTQHLMELLADLDEPYVMVDGRNRPDMVRRLSYTIFILKKARKFLFVNDEAENATFVIHHFEENTDWKDYRKRKKEELRKMSEQLPHLVSVLEFRRGMDGFIESLRQLIEQAYVPDTVDAVESDSDAELGASWMTEAAISQRTGVRVDGVHRWVEKLRLPEDAPDCTNADGDVEHWGSLSERVINILERPVAPADWWNIRQIADALGRSRQYCEKILEPIIQEQGDLMDWYYTRSERGRGVLAEHYNTQAVDAAKAVLEGEELAPEGWRTEKSLQTEFGGNQSKYGNIADQYREAHPEWFYPYLTRGKKGGRKHEHFAPELVDIIIAELRRRGQVPPVFETTGE